MRGRYIMALGVLTTGLVGCSARQQMKPLSKDFMEKMNGFREQSAVTRNMERQVVPPSESAAAPAGPVTLGPREAIWLQSGKTRVLQLARPVRRVSIGNPDLVTVTCLGPRTLLLDAKDLPKQQDQALQQGNVGTQHAATISNHPLTPEPHTLETTLVVWDGANDAESHTVVVADFINEQVLLEVTVAEIKRSAMEAHGIDFRTVRQDFVSAFFMGGGAGPTPPGVLNTVDPALGAPLLPLTTTSDAPTYAFQLPNENITGFIQALQTEGLASVLAQPKLVAMSGQTAVFQVGGEIPIRVVSGFAADIEYKPFGTLVTFVPRVSEEGDIMLTVTPEVSQPDFSATVEGVPTFRTRRASTSARLRSGQTLVIGGLLQTHRNEEERGLPYLKNLPVVGYVFRNTAYTDETTELVVVATPRIVKPIPVGETLPLPTDRGPLTFEETKTQPGPAEVTRPRIPLAFD